jgi:hypothetical protein
MSSMRQSVLVLLTLLACAGPLYAHGLGVSWKEDTSGAILIEAYFDDNTAAASAKVEIVEGDGTVVASGTTDEKGQCRLARPGPGRYRVQVAAEGGHRTHRSLIVPGEASKPASGDGPTREEFTRFPWWPLAIGAGLLVGAAWAVQRRLSRRRAIGELSTSSDTEKEQDKEEE